MAFYAFRLNSIYVQNQRGKVPDVDVVTFQVLVNTVLKGQGMITLPAITSGTTVQLALPPSNTFSFTPLAPSETSSNISTNWIIGPMGFGPKDGVSVVISITNISDNWSGTDETKQDQTEIDIANEFYGALVGEAVDGVRGLLVGTVLTKGSELLGKIIDILGVLKDPVGELLGADSGGPCNGLAFASQTSLLGNEVAALTFVPPSTYQSLTGALEFEKSVSGDDKANHPGNCGQPAETTVSFSILQVDSESLRTMLSWCFPTQSAANGLRQFVSAGKGFSVRNLVNSTV